MRFGLALSALLIGIATIAFVDGEGTSITNDNDDDDSMKAKAQFGGAGEVPSDHQRALLVQPSASSSASATTSSYSFTKVGDGACQSTKGTGYPPPYPVSYLMFTGKATREDCESQCSSCPGGQLTGINLIGYSYWGTGKVCFCHLDGSNFSSTACNNSGVNQGTGTNVCTVSSPPNGWVCYKADTSPVCPTPSPSPRPSVSPTQTQTQTHSPTTNSKASKARMPKSIKLNANAEDTILQAQKMKSEGSRISV
eukprot:scaffold26738_cov68-Skeletonema_menzelii.AAC.1